MIDELQEGGHRGPEREPCLMVAGYFPMLPATAPPLGGPVPRRAVRVWEPRQAGSVGSAAVIDDVEIDVV